MSILRHIKIVFFQLSKAPILTVLLLTGAGVMAGVDLAGKHDLTIVEVAISVAAVVLGALFLKAGFMFFAYRVLNDEPFNGSFLLVASIITPILILALWLGAVVASPRIDDFPRDELLFLLLGLYGLLALFLFAAFRMSHWFFGLFKQKRSTAR